MTGSLADVRVITFDVGGTLLRPHPSVGEIYREIARTFTCECSARALESGFDHALKIVSKNYCIKDSHERERDFWQRIVRETFAFAGSLPDDFDSFFSSTWDAFSRGERWRLLPGAAETLTRLRGAGYALGVLSNWDQRLHRVLRETGLRDFFSAVVISSEVGVDKPDPAIFHHAQTVLHASPEICLHVGDSRRHDLEGAHRAGWQALIVRHDTGPCVDGEINSLADLPPLLTGQ